MKTGIYNNDNISGSWEAAPDPPLAPGLPQASGLKQELINKKQEIEDKKQKGRREF